MSEIEEHDVNDAELDAVAARVRAHRRRELAAKLAGSSIALVGMVAGCASNWILRGTDLDWLAGRAFWIVFVLFVVAGAFVYKLLEPKQHLDDIE